MYSAYGAYEQKALYQRNLTIGIMVATILSCAIGAVVFIAGSAPDPELQIGADEFIVLVSGKALFTPSGEEPSVSAADRSGFVVLNSKFRIVPDQPGTSGEDTIESLAPSPVDELTSAPDLNSAIYDRLSTLGDGGHVVDINSARPEPMIIEQPKNREISVIRKIDPDYPRDALEAHREGRVTLRVCVGEDGRLKSFDVDVVRRHKRTVQQVSYVVVHEEPEGYSFAENLLKVLPHWIFRPMIENGDPVESQLEITYTFVLSGARKYSLERISSTNSFLRRIR